MSQYTFQLILYPRQNGRALGLHHGSGNLLNSLLCTAPARYATTAEMFHVFLFACCILYVSNDMTTFCRGVFWLFHQCCPLIVPGTHSDFSGFSINPGGPDTLSGDGHELLLGPGRVKRNPILILCLCGDRPGRFCMGNLNGRQCCGLAALLVFLIAGLLACSSVYIAPLYAKALVVGCSPSFYKCFD